MIEVAALILAAGRSTRFAEDATTTKAVARLAGTPLVRLVAEAALGSRARPVIVVTGFAAGTISAVLDGCDLCFIHAEDYEKGQAHSLRAGVNAVPLACTGVVVLLADMPLITSALIDDLVNAFERMPGAAAIVPTFEGRRGNPVLLSRNLFPAINDLQGDRGAGPLLSNLKHVIEWPVSGSSIHIDIDTKGELYRLGTGNRFRTNLPDAS